VICVLILLHFGETVRMYMYVCSVLCVFINLFLGLYRIWFLQIRPEPGPDLKRGYNSLLKSDVKPG